MNEIRRVLSAAAWRLWLIRALRSFIVTLSGAIVAMMLLLVIQRTFGFALEWPGDWAMIAGLALGVAAVLALGWSALTRTRGLRVACELDERADLRESLSSALCFANSKDPWAAEVVRTARDKAVGVKVNQAIPITGPRFWPVPLALGLAMVVMVYTVPEWDVLGLFKKRQEQQQNQQRIQDVKAEIQKDHEKLQDLLNKAKVELGEDEAKEGAEQKEIQNPEQIRRSALKKLTTMQEKLNELKQGEKSLQLEALKQQLRQLKQPGPGPMDNMAKSLQKGDFDNAQKDLEELQKQMAAGEMSPEQKQEMQEQLKKLADQMAKLAEERKDLEKKLEQAGMNKEQAKQAAKNPEALKKALEDLKEMSEEQKQELMKQAAAQNQACQNCQNMGQCMAQMAASMSKDGMSQEGMEAGEKLAGQLSQMELAQADMEALELAMDEAMSQMAKLGGQCQGGEPGEGEGECEGNGISPWRAGDSTRMGNGSGGPGMGNGMSPDEIDSPVTIEKKKAASKQTAGPIIGTRLVYGDQVKGESRAEFAAAVASSTQAATDAIEGMVVPRELHNSVKSYFGSLENKGKGAEPAKK
ncbi:MAG: hypothetical protein WD749_04890 [Phycisphaerales bacterium]